jgi:hypothetical protein
VATASSRGSARCSHAKVREDDPHHALIVLILPFKEHQHYEQEEKMVQSRFGSVADRLGRVLEASVACERAGVIGAGVSGVQVQDLL